MRSRPGQSDRPQRREATFAFTLSRSGPGSSLERDLHFLLAQQLFLIPDATLAFVDSRLFAELHQAPFSRVAGAAEAWQIPEADLAGMMSFTEDEAMCERAKELRDQVHRDGVRIDVVFDAIVDCARGAELLARVRV